MFYHPTFGSQYNVYSDIYIDGSGIHDGPVLHPWNDMASCNIGESDIEDLKRYFGDDYDECPYAITMTRKDGSKHNITLFGQGWDKVVKTGKAINHFSGVEMVSKEKLKGDPIPLPIIIGIIIVTAALIISLFL